MYESTNYYYIALGRGSGCGGGDMLCDRYVICYVICYVIGYAICYVIGYVIDMC